MRHKPLVGRHIGSGFANAVGGDGAEWFVFVDGHVVSRHIAVDFVATGNDDQWVELELDGVLHQGHTGEHVVVHGVDGIAK